MQKDFDYSEVPLDFTHCINTQCVHANNCLRHKVTLHATPDRTRFTIYNPASLPANGENCTYFFADKKAQFALGITHLVDNLPYKMAKEVKDAIIRYFPRNTYYRIRNKQRLIKPEEMAYIRRLFRDKGIKEEPMFDDYVDMYEW